MILKVVTYTYGQCSDEQSHDVRPTRCYLLVKEHKHKDWYHAATHCQSLTHDSDLVAITNADIQRAVADSLPSHGGKPR